MKRETKICEGSNKLWEGSRIILPEHKEQLNEWRKRREGKAKKPVMTDWELHELAAKLNEAKETGTELMLNVWEHGRVEGRITRLDPERKMVHVEKYGHVTKVPFFNILSAETLDY